MQWDCLNTENASQRQEVYIIQHDSMEINSLEARFLVSAARVLHVFSLSGCLLDPSRWVPQAVPRAR